MKIIGKLVAFTAALSLNTMAHAILIAEYDLAPAPTPTGVVASFVEPGFTATNLQHNSPDPSSAPFSNHFYHSGWNTALNLNKFYETTLSGANPFALTTVDFSLEGTPAGEYWLRSSIDGFTSDLASGAFINGLVTDFSVDLSGLGTITSPVSFRWFMATANTNTRAGFANHEPGGTGGGLADRGQDLQFFGELVDVPEPSALFLMGMGILGAGVLRRKKA